MELCPGGGKLDVVFARAPGGPFSNNVRMRGSLGDLSKSITNRVITRIKKNV